MSSTRRYRPRSRINNLRTTATFVWTFILAISQVSLSFSTSKSFLGVNGLVSNPKYSTTKHSLNPPNAKEGRRQFLTRAIQTLVTTSATTGLAITSSPAHVNAATTAAPSSSFIKTPNEIVADMKRDKTVYVPYEQFREWLANDQLLAVQFGKDGTSLACVDAQGGPHQLRNLPDDPRLLKDLYEHRVTVTVEQYVFPKQMNAVAWFQDLVGIENADEDPTTYRGYKTYRQNIPERAYVPSNILTGYDMSRNMYKNKK